MTEDINIEIKKDCEICLFKDECCIKELDTNICVWFLNEDKYQIVEENGMLYIEEVKQ